MGVVVTFKIASLITLCGMRATDSLVIMHIVKKNWPGRPIQWFGIVLGLVACSAALLTGTKNYVIFAVCAGPIIATTHLLYLSKVGKPTF